MVATTTSNASIFNNDVCNERSTLHMSIFAIECICGSFLIALCIRSLSELKENNLFREMKYLHLSQTVFFVAAILSAILSVHEHFEFCFTESTSSLSDISWSVSIGSYLAQSCALLWALFFRIYYISKETTLEISSHFISVFFCLFCIGGLCCLGLEVYYGNITDNAMYSEISQGVMLWMAFIFHFILSKQFVTKLIAVSSYSVDSPTPSDNGMDGDLNGDLNGGFNGDVAQQSPPSPVHGSQSVDESVEWNIEELIRKYTLLSVATTISGFIVSVLYPICVITDMEILTVFLIANVLFNVVCVSLSLSFYSHYYVKFCGHPDTVCEHWHTRKSIKKLERTATRSEAELESESESDTQRLIDDRGNCLN